MGTPPLQNISEMQDILQISEKGDCLTPYQLERVETVENRKKRHEMQRKYTDVVIETEEN